MIAIFLIYNFSGLRPSFNFNNIEEFKKINLISNKFQKVFYKYNILQRIYI